mgnify:CR=1 FL=1
MSVIKLIAWRAVATVAMIALLPTFWIMGDMDDWRRVWAEAMEER